MRQRLNALGTRSSREAEPDLSYLTDEELERLDKLLARHIVLEQGPDTYRHGPHGPDGGLERCECTWCQIDSTPYPLTESEERQMEALLRTLES